MASYTRSHGGPACAFQQLIMSVFEVMGTSAHHTWDSDWVGETCRVMADQMT
jgi:hypothetical protein